jgi:TetR/AcrR family transcriptional regulator, transcriptional repressor for nem operon
LIVEALEHALAHSRKRVAALSAGADESHEKEPLQAIAEMFLSERHVKNPGTGCALCALAGEARHAAPEVRERLTTYVHSLASKIAQTLAGHDESAARESAALGIVATIVGAVTLARAVDDKKLAKSILSASLDLIVAQGGGT